MIKAVIFDIGGVLSRYISNENRSRWEKRLGLPAEGLERAFFHSPVAARGFIGQASDAEVWDDFRQRFNLTPADIVDLYREFWMDAEFDTQLLDYIRGLRPRYRTGVISDALPGARHEERVKAHVNYDLFDVILFSGEEGVLKPDARIFDRALAALGVERAEAIFVDDTLSKIVGANALGLHGVQFISREQTLAEIERLLAAD
jgi:epoxide hydrolase-like predicted phosphatase